MLSTVAVGLLAAAGLAAPAPAHAAPPAPREPGPGAPKVTIAILPPATTIHEVADLPGMALGLMFTDRGADSPAQTFVDITQGARVVDSLYDQELPALRVRGDSLAGWAAARQRAETAPADIEPGLLFRVLEEDGVSIAAGRGAGLAAILATAPDGKISRRQGARVRVQAMSRARARVATASLAPGELLIAFARPPPAEGSLVALGIAGDGFAGNLTSESTRTRGLVLAADLAPTILKRLGIPIPSEMAGTPISGEGKADPAGIAARGERMYVIESRRSSVLHLAVGIWLAVAAGICVVSRGRWWRPALRSLSLAVVYLPVLCLLTAAIEPSLLGERLIVGLGSPLAAALTVRLLASWRALAVATSATTLACAVDVIAGSPLTSLSLMGPTPILGIRFFGIGNILEAALVPIVLGGAGAALAGFAPQATPRAQALTVLAAGAAAALIFGAGAFGADVAAAIVFPFGAALAAAVASGKPRWIWAALAAPLVAVAALALIDTLLGGEAHLSRTVLGADGADGLAEVAERRLDLTWTTFSDGIETLHLQLTLAVIALGVIGHRPLLRRLGASHAFRAGWLGAAAAVILGSLANDSGALVLEVGTVFATALAGFACAEA